MTQLEDLKQRIYQFIELNNHALEVGVADKSMLEGQNNGFIAVIALIEQLEEFGKVYRGNDAFPDAVEAALRDIRPQTSLL